MSYSESTMPHSPTNSELLIEEERLEEIDNSDDEKYYEAVDVQPLVSTPSPPSPMSKKKIKREPRNHKYQCHQCGLTFTSQDLLKMHMHQSHDMQLHTRFVYIFFFVYTFSKHMILDLCASIADTILNTPPLS